MIKPLYNSILYGIFLGILTLQTLQLTAQVTQRDTLVVWNHFDYALDDQNGMDWYSTTNIVEEVFPGVVLENEYVRLVVLPEFGARIISFYYKPTGQEQLYTNPVGAPYGMGDGNFYYDWLMVYGGIFPTFPEPEHGKTWFLPWEWAFTELTDERISLQMELQDTIDFPGHPGKFDNGVTEVRCISTISLEQGAARFEWTHELQNTKQEPVTLEYWTCTTLAPGSEPGNTFTPANSEMVVPIDYVYLKDDWWSWMGMVDEPAPQFGSHVFEYKNLAIYDNWEDMGIAYAYPELTGNYYGVINHENGSGIFRVADNESFTPGMKFWTWGAQQGLNADPQNFYDNARPYIELWSGLSNQFFVDAQLDAGETVSWTETYLPTVSMDTVHLVNESGAMQLNTEADGDDRVVVSVFLTHPGSVFHLQVFLNGSEDVEMYDVAHIAESTISTQQVLYLEDYMISDGEYDLVAHVVNENDEILLADTVPVTIPLPSSGLVDIPAEAPRMARLSESLFQVSFKEPGTRELAVFSISGSRISQRTIYDVSALIEILTPGIYIIRVVDKDSMYSLKIQR